MNKHEKHLPHQMGVFVSLTKRHLMVFFKNIPTVIFTLMVPVAIFAVYVIFLRQLETSTIKEALDGMIKAQSTSTLEIGSDAYKDVLSKVYGIADCWMIAGVLAVSCITVSLNTNYIVVRDKESGVNRDFISSPIDSRVTVASYFVFNVIVTFLINFIVYLICLIYLLIYGAYMITFVDFWAIIGVLLLSTISASLITFFICSFIHTEAVLSPIVAIFSAAVGFLVGAYLPANMGPKYIGYITTFFPGTYSVGLLRNYFLTAPIKQLALSLSPYGLDSLIEELQAQFSLNIDFFGNLVSPSIMWIVLVIFSGIFGALNLIFADKNFLRITFSKKKKKKNINQTEEIHHEVNEKSRN